jgi:hypothetical protein
MSEFWISTWAAVIGAIFGAGMTYLMGAEDRKRARLTLDAQREASKSQREASEAQQKLAELQGHQTRLEAFDRFTPRVELLLNSGKQFVRLEAAEPFHVESMDYLNATGAKIASRAIDQNEMTITVPIEEEPLNTIRRVGPWVNYNDLSAHVILRFNLRRGQQTKQIMHNGIIRQLNTDIGGGRSANIVQIVG